jgi:hypothetical protein
VYLIAPSFRLNSAVSSLTVILSSRFVMILKRSLELISGLRRAFLSTSCLNRRCVGIVMTRQSVGVGGMEAGSG